LTGCRRLNRFEHPVQERHECLFGASVGVNESPVALRLAVLTIRISLRVVHQRLPDHSLDTGVAELIEPAEDVAHDCILIPLV